MLGGNQNIGGQGVVITEIVSVSQLLEGKCPATQVYVYGFIHLRSYKIILISGKNKGTLWFSLPVTQCKCDLRKNSLSRTGLHHKND